MRLRIRSGGQTGVDAGALRGAIACGLEVCGWMPSDERDENGLIPDDIRAHLRRINTGGYRARTERNVEDADAVVIVIPDAVQGIPPSDPGTLLTWRTARKRDVPVIVVDGSDRQVSRIAPWLRDVAHYYADAGVTTLDVMVAGPRRSNWPWGEETAWRVVQRIAEVCR